MKEKSKHMNIPKIRFKGFEDTAEFNLQMQQNSD